MFASPNVTLSEPLANSYGSPIAINTCDGLEFPELQAEPDEAHIPFSSNLNKSVSASIPLNEKLQFPGSLFFLSPLSFTLSILSSVCAMK